MRPYELGDCALHDCRFKDDLATAVTRPLTSFPVTVGGEGGGEDDDGRETAKAIG